MLNTKLVTWSAAVFTAASYLLCITYGLIVPESLHMHGFLEAVLPAFEWLDPMSFFLGLAESFLWGVYLGLGYAVVYNRMYPRFTPSAG
jgi:uncharacterized protein DUF5676